MASYAALLSVMHTLNTMKRHPRPPIFISTNQMESLDQTLSFFLNFLERHSGEEDQDLDRRISAAAYATEDVIDSHILRRIHSESDSNSDEDEVDSHVLRRIHSGSDISTTDSSQCMDLISTIDLYQGLERAIQDMEVIKKEVTIKEKMSGREPLRRRHASTHHQSNTIFEFDDVLINKVLDKLIAHESFQVIPIVGMGGIGKTSLAQNIYTSYVTIHHFDILVWVSISQEFSVTEILSLILSERNNGSEDNLGERVHQKLWGRRYLIVMDDIWGIDAWDQVKSFFPDNNNGSRVMITTRLSKLAFDISGSRDFKINFLDENKSLALFCKIVFGTESCPIELEDIAKKIVRNCRGLPLSIVVTGGLLKYSNMTSTYWNYILEDLSSLINLEDDEYCLQLLHTSYKELPIHLKSCFLYMGIFREDDEIRVSKLIKLWVAEGILRPNEDKRLEEVAEECIMELVERNLIYVHKLRWNGEVKLCRMHDLLRDLCLREGKKQRFLCTILRDSRDIRTPKYMNMVRRICIIQDYTEEDYYSQLCHSLESATLTRSLILQRGWPNNPSSFTYRLLRVLTSAYGEWWPNLLKAIFQNINLRYLNVHSLYDFSSSLILLWNLQTIKVGNSLTSQPVTAPSEIWEIFLLRHVMITNLQLPDPPCGDNDIHLEDLQTLSCVTNFKCSKAVVKRIQNIRILKLRYEISFGTDYHRFYVNNFYHLKNLQALNLKLSVITEYVEEIRLYMEQNLNFPHSLKKLTLCSNVFNWEECRTKIGLLPNLEYLKLDCYNSGPEWETVEGQFCSLKFLHLLQCRGLRIWKTDNTHYPCLEHLFLEYLVKLEEIPSSIGHIPTLKSIKLDCCSKSAADSARSIKEEQIELGNEDLEFIIITEEEEEEEDEEEVEEEEEELNFMN